MFLLLLVTGVAAYERSGVDYKYIAEIENKLLEPPELACKDDGLRIGFNTAKPFQGNVYVKGKFSAKSCKAEGTPVKYTKAITFDISFEECGLKREPSGNGPEGDYIAAVVVVMFHSKFLTKADEAFEFRCFYSKEDTKVSAQIAVSAISPNVVTDGMEMPTCSYEVLRGGPGGKTVKFASIGDHVFHQWSCTSEQADMFCMRVHSCHVDDGNGDRVNLLMRDGCSIDQFLLGDIEYMDDLTAGRSAFVFKYADKPILRFHCEIAIFLKTGGKCDLPPCGPPAGSVNGYSAPSIDSSPEQKEKPDKEKSAEAGKSKGKETKDSGAVGPGPPVQPDPPDLPDIDGDPDIPGIPGIVPPDELPQVPGKEEPEPKTKKLRGKTKNKDDDVKEGEKDGGKRKGNQRKGRGKEAGKAKGKEMGKMESKKDGMKTKATGKVGKKESKDKASSEGKKDVEKEKISSKPVKTGSKEKVGGKKKTGGKEKSQKLIMTVDVERKAKEESLPDLPDIPIDLPEFDLDADHSIEIDQFPDLPGLPDLPIDLPGLDLDADLSIEIDQLPSLPDLPDLPGVPNLPQPGRGVGGLAGLGDFEPGLPPDLYDLPDIPSLDELAASGRRQRQRLRFQFYNLANGQQQNPQRAKAGSGGSRQQVQQHDAVLKQRSEFHPEDPAADVFGPQKETVEEPSIPKAQNRGRTTQQNLVPQLQNQGGRNLQQARSGAVHSNQADPHYPHYPWRYHQDAVNAPRDQRRQHVVYSLDRKARQRARARSRRSSMGEDVLSQNQVSYMTVSADPIHVTADSKRNEAYEEVCLSVEVFAGAFAAVLLFFMLSLAMFVVSVWYLAPKRVEE